MEHSTFAERLDAAAARAVKCARDFVEETLPDEVRFRVRLNASYDGNPLHADERVFPDDHLVHATELLARLDRDEVIALLFRAGAVPEWINASVVDVEDGATIVELLSCGRFTANAKLLYHERAGIPPFHVLGPALPPEWNEGEPRRFSLYWSPTVQDAHGLRRLAAHATKVRILVLEGAWCDDDALASLEFPSLMTLLLRGTRASGSGLAHAKLGESFQYLTLTGERPISVAALARFRHLRNLTVAGQSIDGLSALGELCGLEWLTIHVAALDTVDFASKLPALEWLNLDGTAISCLAPLAHACALEHLLLRGTRVGDDELRHLFELPRLATLTLSATEVSDAGVIPLATIPTLRSVGLDRTRMTDETLRAFASWRMLKHLDVRKTRVTLGAVADLFRLLPDLNIVADGWDKLPRHMIGEL